MRVAVCWIVWLWLEVSGLKVVNVELLRSAQEALRSARADSSNIRCPFWRRRAADAIEASESMLRFLMARHKSLGVWCEEEATPRRRHRSIEAVAGDLRREFDERHYYITGRLDTSLYAPDAFFDAPDPDMPVRGAAKFADALSGLFDPRVSYCDLLDIRVADNSTLVALWRLEGVLRLPWRPTVAPFVGETTYTLDDARLIASHVERWSCTATEAFASAVVPPHLAGKWRVLPRRPIVPPSAHYLRAHPEQARALLRTRASRGKAY